LIIGCVRNLLPSGQGTAHTSSKKNNKVGDWVGLGRWDVDEIMSEVLPMLQGGAAFHPPLSPILFTQYEPKTEEDGIDYSHFAIFDPVITILQGYFPSLQIRTFSEDTHVRTIGSESAESRMDVLIKARPLAFPQNDWETILLYEAKAPGTLWREDWDNTVRGERRLQKNARILGGQGRKYLQAAHYSEVVFGDTQALAGIRLQAEEDRDDLGMNADVQGDYFFMENHMNFLPIILNLQKAPGGQGIATSQCLSNSLEFKQLFLFDLFNTAKLFMYTVFCTHHIIDSSWTRSSSCKLKECTENYNPSPQPTR
jgi:hypothetical protein